MLQVKQYVQEVSWLLKFQTDKDHGYAGLDGLHTSEYPIVRSAPTSAPSYLYRQRCHVWLASCGTHTWSEHLHCCLSWAFGRLTADHPRLDAWNSRGTAPQQHGNIEAMRIPGVSPFMQTLAYRTRSFLANRFRCQPPHNTPTCPPQIAPPEPCASADVLFPDA